MYDVSSSEEIRSGRGRRPASASRPTRATDRRRRDEDRGRATGLRGGDDAPRRHRARRGDDDAVPLRREQGRAARPDGRRDDGRDAHPRRRARRRLARGPRRRSRAAATGSSQAPPLARSSTWTTSRTQAGRPNGLRHFEQSLGGRGPHRPPDSTSARARRAGRRLRVRATRCAHREMAADRARPRQHIAAMVDVPADAAGHRRVPAPRRADGRRPARATSSASCEPRGERGALRARPPAPARRDRAATSTGAGSVGPWQTSRSSPRPPAGRSAERSLDIGRRGPARRQPVRPPVALHFEPSSRSSDVRGRPSAAAKASSWSSAPGNSHSRRRYQPVPWCLGHGSDLPRSGHRTPIARRLRLSCTRPRSKVASTRTSSKSGCISRCARGPTGTCAVWSSTCPHTPARRRSSLAPLAFVIAARVAVALVLVVVAIAVIVATAMWWLAWLLVWMVLSGRRYGDREAAIEGAADVDAAPSRCRTAGPTPPTSRERPGAAGRSTSAPAVNAGATASSWACSRRRGRGRGSRRRAR